MTSLCRFIAVLATLAITALSPGLASPASSAGPDLAPIAIPFGSTCYACDFCINEAHHDIWPSTFAIRIGPHDHGCTSEGSCDDHATTCTITLSPDLLERARYAVIDGNARALRALIGSSSDVVRFNPVRRAVQVVGCDGNSIVANMPVDAELAAHLDD